MDTVFRKADKAHRAHKSLAVQSTQMTGKATTAKGRKYRIRSRRQAFKSLPVFFSNDIVHGSWWFTLGSFFFVVISFFPLIDIHTPIFHVDESTALSAFADSATWVLTIISGLFYTFGSYLFVRAFEDPPRTPLMVDYYHFRTDELLAAWIFLLASLPSIPFSLVFLGSEPHNQVYWGLFLASILFVLGSAGFVYTCYPTESDGNHDHSKKILILVRCCFGENGMMARHLANDWLATSWFFFYMSVIMTLGSVYYLGQAANSRQVFVWSTSLIDSIIFTIGSAYFVSGSYPPPQEDHDLNHDEEAERHLEEGRDIYNPLTPMKAHDKNDAKIKMGSLEKSKPQRLDDLDNIRDPVPLEPDETIPAVSRQAKVPKKQATANIVASSLDMSDSERITTRPYPANIDANIDADIDLRKQAKAKQATQTVEPIRNTAAIEDDPFDSQPTVTAVSKTRKKSREDSTVEQFSTHNDPFDPQSEPHDDPFAAPVARAVAPKEKGAKKKKGSITSANPTAQREEDEVTF